MTLLLGPACKPGGVIEDVYPSDSSTAGQESAETVGGGDADADGDADTDTDGGGNDQAYEAFFDPATVQQVDIEISAENIMALNANGREYVEANVTVNGEYFDTVGLRLKGSSTYEDFDCSDGACKPAFKIKLNEYVSGQKYAGLKRITLNNMSYDYTQSKEIIVYPLLNDAGALASRASFAWVTVNSETYGLYANVESADDEWVEARYEDATGDFWGTASDSGDFSVYGLSTRADGSGPRGWILKSGTGDTTRLEAVKLALDNATSGDFFGAMGDVVDTEQFLDYWAWCVAVGNYDGYPFHLNDVLIYADPSDSGRFDFAPWGTDETWDETQDWNYLYGRLGLLCYYDPNCVAELKTRTTYALEFYEAADVLGRAEAAWALTDPLLLEDTRRPYWITMDYIEYYRAYYAALIPQWPDRVRSHMGL
jgi:hypothetical protein